MNERITHGIFWKGKPITRASFYTNDLSQYHFFVIEPELLETLKRKMKSWKNKVDYLEFTYGYNDNYALITIVSPKDQYNKRIGYQITLGRLKRANKVYEDEYGINNGYIQVVKKEVAEQCSLKKIYTF